MKQEKFKSHHLMHPEQHQENLGVCTVQYLSLMHGFVSSTAQAITDFFLLVIKVINSYFVSQMLVYHNQLFCSPNFNFDAN